MQITRDKFKSITDNRSNWREILTESELNIIDLWLNGETFTSIAETYNRNRESIAQVIRGMGRYHRGSTYLKILRINGG